MTNKPVNERLCPTTYEYFLYLLIEMERLVERGCIKWTPDLGFNRVNDIVNLAERLLQETLLLKAARDTGSVLAEIRLLGAHVPPR